MTTARDVIKLVIEDIDSELKMLESSYEFARKKYNENNQGKKSAMAKGMDYVLASDEYDFSIGYFSATTNECEDSIKVLKRKRDYYLSLDKLYAEEEKEEAEGNE